MAAQSLPALHEDYQMTKETMHNLELRWFFFFFKKKKIDAEKKRKSKTKKKSSDFLCQNDAFFHPHCGIAHDTAVRETHLNVLHLLIGDVGELHV